MATSIDEQKIALAKAKVLFNTFASQFNASSLEIATVPELAPVLTVFRAIADVANAQRQTLVDAIADVGGLDASSFTTEQQAAATDAMKQVTDALTSFEQSTGLIVAALQLQHVAPDSTSVSDFILI